MQSTRPVKVSVIVVTYNQHDVLRLCLRSVVRASDGLDAELIVVDNASTDATPSVVTEEFPSARSIRNPVNLYYTRAVNQGMRAARGEYVYLLNDDIELEPNNLRALSAFMDAHPECGAVGPVMRAPGGGADASVHKFPTPVRESLKILGIAYLLRNAAWARPIQQHYPPPVGTQRVDWVCGGAMFLRRATMEALGYHDEHYLFYRDDPDIGMRLRKAGLQVWYNAETHVVHYHGISTVKTARKPRFDLISVRSRRHYHRKFHGWAGMALVESAYALASTLRMVKCLVLGRATAARGHLKAIGALFEARRPLREELEAIEGYRRCQFNGMETPTDVPGKADAQAATCA